LAGSIRDITARDAEQQLIDRRRFIARLAEANRTSCLGSTGAAFSSISSFRTTLIFRSRTSGRWQDGDRDHGTEFAAAQQHYVERRSRRQLQIWEHQIEKGPGRIRRLESRFVEHG
jgi:hypothetical protein